MSVDRVRLDDLLARARARAASDLHVGGGTAPSLRVDGRIVVLDEGPLADAAVRAFVDEALSAEARTRLATAGTADAACRAGHAAPYRLHAYRTTAGLRCAIRLLATRIPRLEDLACRRSSRRSPGVRTA